MGEGPRGKMGLDLSVNQTNRQKKKKHFCGHCEKTDLCGPSSICSQGRDPEGGCQRLRHRPGYVQTVQGQEVKLRKRRGRSRCELLRVFFLVCEHGVDGGPGGRSGLWVCLSVMLVTLIMAEGSALCGAGVSFFPVVKEDFSGDHLAERQTDGQTEAQI